MVHEGKNEETIFNAAIQLKKGPEREAYLNKICGEDSKLRADVEALLQAHEAKNLIDEPIFDIDVTLDHSALIERPGTMIGRYKLLELIGEGGMGLVYLAEQQEPIRRKVALKIVKLGMDTKQVIARFEAERQALAVLDHPNIAHVYDAGTTETGRPYFVMEYVKGISITKYCDERKLNIEQRLRLFEQVCEGVHHAHQKGIIHRDIKPSNILVSVHGDRAVPKIIDFGIAKAITQPLTEETFFTQQGQLLGTLEYMSPEQVDMATQDIDTRSDIYSLGVVLYELLAGVLPFEKESFERAGFAEIQHTLRELEPASPSIRLTALGEEAKTIAASRGTQVVALARRLHRELEWIPLKAMRKDRCRRYKSASEMADDIRNYLNGNPLIAGPETAMYRVKKFVRKHAGSVTTVALVAVAIILGLVVSTAMYFRAEQARVRAESAEKVAKEKTEKLRQTLYVNSIQLADAKYGEGNIRRVRKLLESCPEDLRAWEWHRLKHISDQACMTIRGLKGLVNSISFSADGRRIISGCNDNTIKVWDAKSGGELMTLRGHKDKVGPVSASPDGKRIVSGSSDSTIKIWDATSGTELMALLGHKGRITSVSFSEDGRRIVSGSTDNTVKVWDAESGAELITLREHEHWITNTAFSPDGKRIVSSAGDGTFRVWDAHSGAELMTNSSANTIWVNCVAFSPDGKRIVSCGGWDNKIKVWDALTGEEVLTLIGHQRGSIITVEFSHDGRLIVSAGGGSDSTIKVWDASTGDELITLLGHEGPVRRATFSPDDERIVSWSTDGTIKVWSANLEVERLTLLGHKEKVTSLAFSPDGKRLASGSSDTTIKVWDVVGGVVEMTLRGHQQGVRDIAFSHDGKRIVSAGADKVIKVWDTATGSELLNLPGHNDLTGAVTFSPDGKYIVSGGGSKDKTVKIWDALTGLEITTLEGHTGDISSIAISSDGKRILSSGCCDVDGNSDGTLRLWDIQSGAELLTCNHGCGVFSVAFSPDSKYIASGGSDAPGRGRTIKIWNANNGVEVMTLRGHRMGIDSVMFSPDGTRILSSSWDDQTVKLWDTATGSQVMAIPTNAANYSARFSPDGKTIAIGDGHNIVFLESEVPPDGYESRQTGIIARQVVDELYKEIGFYSEVIDKLNADKMLAEPVHKVALQIANARRWEDAEKLNKEKQNSESAGEEEMPAEQKTESR